VTQELKFYCLRCDEVICTDCKLTRHEGHTTDDLKVAVERAKEQLKEERVRIDASVHEVREKITAVKERNKEIAKHRKAMGKCIREMYSANPTQTNRQRDARLQEAGRAFRRKASEIQAVLEELHAGQQTLVDLLEEVTHAVNAESGLEVMAMAKKIKSGNWSAKAEKMMTHAQVPDVLQLDSTNSPFGIKREIVFVFLCLTFFVLVLPMLLEDGERKDGESSIVESEIESIIETYYRLK
jgi:hypothetical protein